MSRGRHAKPAAAAGRGAGLLRAGAVAALVLLAFSVAGAASAYFRTTGAGTGAAASGTASTVVLAAGAAGSDLYPGGTGTVTTTVTNAGDADVRLPSLQLDTTQGSGGFAVDAAHSACALTSFTFTTATNGGNGWTLGAGDSLPITLSGSLELAASAANACQGASVTVFLKVAS